MKTIQSVFIIIFLISLSLSIFQTFLIPSNKSLAQVQEFTSPILTTTTTTTTTIWESQHRTLTTIRRRQNAPHVNWPVSIGWSQEVEELPWFTFRIISYRYQPDYNFGRDALWALNRHRKQIPLTSFRASGSGSSASCSWPFI